jgi:hypothetical protein
MAVPMTVKIPEPMTAPMPRAVSDQGPRVFLSLCAGSSESLMSLSIDLRASSWLGSEDLLGNSYQPSAFGTLLLELAPLQEHGTAASCRLKAEGCLVYRFDWPRAIFFTFLFWEPRGVVRLALGAAFLRAARFSFLRSSLSVILVVSATLTSFHRVALVVSRNAGSCDFLW